MVYLLYFKLGQACNHVAALEDKLGVWNQLACTSLSASGHPQARRQTLLARWYVTWTVRELSVGNLVIKQVLRCAVFTCISILCDVK